PGVAEELVDTHLDGVDLVAHVLEVVERRAREARSEPVARGKVGAGGEEREIGVELRQLRAPGVRGGRHREAPGLRLQDGRVVAERPGDEAVVSMALASG